ncbi:MAG TPA: flagellar M-ring protein FliF C-terminal domain-containing protein, partial [Brevundimonas sp.]|nr:flagellar M-ring protein FliF C-terminal domain-containing protein [Brevundimonas sp.]
TTTTVKEAGEIKRLAVSVAVDGKWTPGANGAAPTYAARTPAEIEQIKALVAAAVGIDETRGDKLEVLNTRFNRDLAVVGGEEVKASLFDFTKNDLMRGVELLVLLITGILLIFFVLRPLLKSASGGAGPGGGAMQLAAGLPGGGSVTTLQTTMMGGGAGGPMHQLTGPPSEMEQRLDIARIEGQVKASSVKKVADFVEKHPDESTSILRSWVHEG